MASELKVATSCAPMWGRKDWCCTASIMAMLAANMTAPNTPQPVAIGVRRRWRHSAASVPGWNGYDARRYLGVWLSIATELHGRAQI